MNKKTTAPELFAMTFEMWAASLVTIQKRLELLSTRPPSDPAVQAEQKKMISEKVLVSLETAFVVQKQFLNVFNQPPSLFGFIGNLLSPAHQAVTENANRLSRRKT